MLAHTVQYVLSSLVPRPRYCIASYEMLGGDWEQGYVLSPRLHYQQKIFHSCITDIGTLLGDSIQDRLEDEANSAFSQITDVLNGKCHIAIHC